MRTSHVCPKCRHNHILLIACVADIGEGEITHWGRIAIAYTGEGWLGGDKTEPAGLLSTAVCRRCGFTELYTKNPAEIPVDGNYVREVVGPESPPPYR